MSVTPRQLQDALTQISNESFEKHMELAEISVRAAEAKLELMKTCKNGKEVDMRFAATEDGKREIYLRIYLRGLSHKRTALIQETKNNAGGTW